ncbi:MAG TPA: hypothetical protein VKZ79_07660 [Alphaproteobacteria bacterium]|nr:hypothetical protein [Alphaproteobacteria bacterium]
MSNNIAHWFEQPAPPPAIGPDAELFAQYRNYLATQGRIEELDAKRVGGAELAAADEDLRQALERFISTPAMTAAGMRLKLEYALDGETIPGGDDEATAAVLATLSVIADLRRLEARG